MNNPWREIYDHPQSVDPFKNGVPKAPLYLDIEPTNYCNCKCAFCVGQQQGKRERGYMEFSLFEDICKQASDMKIKGIRFLRWGEPLLHDRIDDMIELAHSYGMLTHVTTNGTLLTGEMAHKLISAGLDSIIISFQGLDMKDYSLLRGDMCKMVMKNVMKLVQIRKNFTNPFIQISTTITDESEEDINEFKENWGRYMGVDYVGIGYTWFKRLEDKSKVKSLVKRAKVLPHHFKCVEVMNKLSIDWDGAVSPCCLDYDQQLTIGNIKDKSLKEMWNSKEIAAIRTLLIAKLQDIFILCSTCELNYQFRGQE